jgi:hypothetical protein
MKYLRWPEVLATVNWFLRHVDDPRASEFVARTLPKHMLARHRSVDNPIPVTDIHAVVAADDMLRVKRPPGRIDVVRAAKRIREEALESKPFYNFEHSPPYTTTQDDRARDWLNSLGDRDLAKLPRMTWQQAIVRSEEWHDAMRRRSERTATIAGDEDNADRIESVDGHYWVRLTTKDALDREGEAMGHCIGRGGYDVYVDSADGARGGGIWSLRDREGRSVLTAEVHRTRWPSCEGPTYVCGHISRFGNARPVNEDRRHVEALENSTMACPKNVYVFRTRRAVRNL